MKERTAASPRRTIARGEARPAALLPPGAEVVWVESAPVEVAEVLELVLDEAVVVEFPPVVAALVVLELEPELELALVVVADELPEDVEVEDPDVEDAALEEAEAVAPMGWKTAP